MIYKPSKAKERWAKSEVKKVTDLHHDATHNNENIINDLVGLDEYNSPKRNDKKGKSNYGSEFFNN